MNRRMAMDSSRAPQSGVPSIDEEAYEWVMRFAEGRANRADLAALKQWIARSPAHGEAFGRISRTWKSLGPVGKDLAADATADRTLPAHDAAPKAGIGRRAFLGGALAASAAGAAIPVVRPPLGLWPSWSEFAADYRTAIGEQREISLTDRATIDLNTRTSLSLRADGTEAEIVAGEAMISTRSDAADPFTVLAAGARIAATAARFNVRVDHRVACVTCVTGDVRVERGMSALSLSPGQQIAYSSERVGQVVTVDPATVSAWRDGIVIFQSTPIDEVIAEVNRYRPGRIILMNKDLGRRLFNARLRIENIGRVVSLIEEVFGARATALPGGILLLG
ncbi:FecR domain-containing protein [Bradyrhizobium sp. BRP22]|uniref:FecR family protein n=1 Tax=Bradyrhizobium sp. BRP22 TaxID=2793821 RepID=UPI001CD5A9F3|nr:FecR domain-containing protein [Bradyrhizobium sp. BRP22]MCA1454173.1 FecR domain-containing protein [Bradyrhizobium sp. BRP22]